MYFKQIDEILSGAKTQTRRVCKDGEVLVYEPHVNPHNVYSRIPGGVWNLATVRSEDRRKWQVGRDYAVSPGRGKPGVWWWQGTHPAWRLPNDVSADSLLIWQPLRICITEIRREPLQDISEVDAIAEGYPHTMPQVGVTILPPVSWYAELWTAINGKGSWRANPDVWVLTFEVVRDA